LYSPWLTRDLLERHPKLRFVADFRSDASQQGMLAHNVCSHWTNVAEAHPSHPELLKVIEAIAPRVLHVHARVGYEEGPQVPDPRAPEWMGYTTAFEHMWKLVWAAQVRCLSVWFAVSDIHTQKSQGLQLSTLCLWTVVDR
jgi:hypothetical protein